MNLLIVDDHATNLKLLRAQLEAEGHNVLEASDGVQALAVLEGAPVDGVISDILMPNMDGFNLCREIRRKEKFGALPFVLYTSTYDSPTDRQLAEAVGADRYVVKPAPTPVILEALHEAMFKARERKHPLVPGANEVYVLKQYSEVLVRKLEEKNSELQEALAKIQRAHEEISQLNRDLEQRVQQRTAELEAANQELDAFASTVAHDLHAPARHVAAYARILLEECSAGMNPTAQGHLLTIAKAGERMGRLITDLLAFARLSRAELRRSAVKLDAVVAQVQAELKPEMKDRAITWRISELPTVQADESMLKQVFFNLLSNAIKYTRTKPSAEIEIGRQANEAGEQVFLVRDNGVGFDMQYAPKLFGVFQRLHPASEFEGTGLGLSIVQRIVQRHGGRAWAEGKVGEGATFYFTL
ncbi:MAG: response regulator [Verrucomicrobia bacterium]|nr:response regulator [Verrucomicrobiota bacterium]